MILMSAQPSADIKIFETTNGAASNFFVSRNCVAYKGTRGNKIFWPFGAAGAARKKLCFRTCLVVNGFAEVSGVGGEEVDPPLKLNQLHFRPQIKRPSVTNPTVPI